MWYHTFMKERTGTCFEVAWKEVRKQEKCRNHKPLKFWRDIIKYCVISIKWLKNKPAADDAESVAFFEERIRRECSGVPEKAMEAVLKDMRGEGKKSLSFNPGFVRFVDEQKGIDSWPLFCWLTSLMSDKMLLAFGLYRDRVDNKLKIMPSEDPIWRYVLHDYMLEWVRMRTEIVIEKIVGEIERRKSNKKLEILSCAAGYLPEIMSLSPQTRNKCKVTAFDENREAIKSVKKEILGGKRTTINYEFGRMDDGKFLGAKKQYDIVEGLGIASYFVKNTDDVTAFANKLLKNVKSGGLAIFDLQLKGKILPADACMLRDALVFSWSGLNLIKRREAIKGIAGTGLEVEVKQCGANVIFIIRKD